MASLQVTKTRSPGEHPPPLGVFFFVFFYCLAHLHEYAPPPHFCVFVFFVLFCVWRVPRIREHTLTLRACFAFAFLPPQALIQSNEPVLCMAPAGPAAAAAAAAATCYRCCHLHHTIQNPQVCERSDFERRGHQRGKLQGVFVRKTCGTFRG